MKKVITRKTIKNSINSNDVILEFQNITKTFLGGNVIANDNVSLKIYRNEIHSLIGENGSGKSTLTSILFGLYKQDSGKILLNGTETNMYEPGAAKKHKIGMVHQHFHLVNEFTVLDNILLGQENAKLGLINRRDALKRFEEISKKYHINLDPKQLVRRLNVGDRQKVEIFKTLWETKEVIIFDEPTATLSVDEIDKLIVTIKKLKSEGKTIIFISHKLQEVKNISDRVSILRKGKLIQTSDNNSALTPTKIAKDMIGSLITLSYSKPKPSEEELLKVKDISYVTPKGFKALNQTSFNLYKGEIFGIAGIQGNGQEELFDIISGLRKSKTGYIIHTEKDIDVLKDSIEQKIEYFSHVPIDRLKHGVVLDEDLRFNSIISTYKWSGFSYETANEDKNFFSKYINFFNRSLNLIDIKKVEKMTKQIITSMNVEGANSLLIPIRNLSGGNQQKFVVGRELNRPFDVLLAGHPTRGLDIKAIDNIYKSFINELKKDKNKAVILYSLELSELIAVCDRIAIMYKGKIVDIINPKQTSMDKISKLMVGEK